MGVTERAPALHPRALPSARLEDVLEVAYTGE